MESNWKVLQVEWLFEADWNYKTDDEGLFAKLLENIRRNDMVQNLLVRQVRKRWEVINGNHRLKALQELGTPTVMCYDFGEISDRDAKRIAVETNETRFISDNTKLGGILKELKEDFDITELCTTLPYSVGEVNNIVDLIDFDFTNLDGDQGPDLGPPPEVIKEVSVRIKWATDDDAILEELQSVVDKYPSATLK